MLENNLLVQLGAVLLTLLISVLGIFKGLVPRLLESTEKRLADKDAVLSQQNRALDEVCNERKELTDRFLSSLRDVVVQNSNSMKALTDTLESVRAKIAEDHELQHLNHRDILDLLHKQKPKTRRKTAKKAAVK